MRPLLVATVALISFHGCATIYNGVTQDVPVLVPDGTVITDTNGAYIPISEVSGYPKFITLKRNREYLLTFDYKGLRAKVQVNRTMNGWWIVPDIVLYVAPVIVDAVTGAWNSFDGVKIGFPDSTQAGGIAVSSYNLETDLSDINIRRKLGMTALFGLGIAGPIGGDQAYIFLLGNSFTYGFGYRVANNTDIMAEINYSYILNVHPSNSEFSSEPSITSYELGVRYYPVGGIYLGAGAGLAHIDTDSLKRHAPEGGVSTVLSPTYANVGTLSFGIGHAGSVGFIELRYKFGLHGFDLSSGERGNLHSVSLRYGLNLEF